MRSTLSATPTSIPRGTHGSRRRPFRSRERRVPDEQGGSSPGLRGRSTTCGSRPKAGSSSSSRRVSGGSTAARVAPCAGTSSLAEDTAGRLPESHPNFAWASNVAGRALHFTSNEEEARHRFDTGLRLASSDDDIKDSLWGLTLTTTEIEPECTSRHLDELGTRYPEDLDVRFRLAVGYAIADDVRGNLRGTWERFETLLPGIQYSRDPLAASTFLASAASVDLASRLQGRSAACSGSDSVLH